MFDEHKKSQSLAMPTKPSKLSLHSVKVAKKKLKNLLIDENEGEKKIYELLEYLTNFSEEYIPECYIELLYEVSKNTPISGILQSTSRTFLAALKSYLDEATDIFLPEPVRNIIEFMLKLFSKMHKLANDRYVKPGIYNAAEPPNEYFPSLLLHSENKNFKADEVPEMRKLMMMTATKNIPELLK